MISASVASARDVQRHVRVVEQPVGPQQLDAELAAQRALGVVARVVGLEMRAVDERGRGHRRTLASGVGSGLPGPRGCAQVSPPTRRRTLSIALLAAALPAPAQAAPGRLQSPCSRTAATCGAWGSGAGRGLVPRCSTATRPASARTTRRPSSRSARRIPPDGPWRAPEPSGLPPGLRRRRSTARATRWAGAAASTPRAPWWSPLPARRRAGTRRTGRPRGRSPPAPARPRSS